MSSGELVDLEDVLKRIVGNQKVWLKLKKQILIENPQAIFILEETSSEDEEKEIQANKLKGKKRKRVHQLEVKRRREGIPAIKPEAFERSELERELFGNCEYTRPHFHLIYDCAWHGQSCRCHRRSVWKRLHTVVQEGSQAGREYFLSLFEYSNKGQRQCNFVQIGPASNAWPGKNFYTASTRKFGYPDKIIYDNNSYIRKTVTRSRYRYFVPYLPFLFFNKEIVDQYCHTEIDSITAFRINKARMNAINDT